MGERTIDVLVEHKALEVVTDNGDPNLSDSQAVTLTVEEVNRALGP